MVKMVPGAVDSWLSTVDLLLARWASLFVSYTEYAANARHSAPRPRNRGASMAGYPRARFGIITRMPGNARPGKIGMWRERRSEQIEHAEKQASVSTSE